MGQTGQERLDGLTGHAADRASPSPGDVPLELEQVEIDLGHTPAVRVRGQTVMARAAIVSLTVDRPAELTLLVPSAGWVRGEAVVREELEPGPVGLQGLAARFAETLNRVRAADPAVMNDLFHVRRECNQSVGDDPFVMVRGYSDGSRRPTLGFLGLLNGMLLEAGSPDLITVVQEDDPRNDNVLGFEARPRTAFGYPPVGRVNPPTAETDEHRPHGDGAGRDAPDHDDDYGPCAGRPGESHGPAGQPAGAVPEPPAGGAHGGDGGLGGVGAGADLAPAAAGPAGQ